MHGQQFHLSQTVKLTLHAALFSKPTTVNPSSRPGIHLDLPLSKSLVYHLILPPRFPHIDISTILVPRSNFDLRYVVHITAYSSRTVLTDLSRAARMSIIFCIIRITNHSGRKLHRWIAYLIALSFLCMWIALLVQKIDVCRFQACQMSESVALSQLISQYLSFILCMVLKSLILTADVFADFSLVAAPLQIWKNVGLSRSRKILVLSSFGASILITATTIPLSVILFWPLSDTALIFAHVRVSYLHFSHPLATSDRCLGCGQSYRLQRPGNRYLHIPRIVERNL